MRQETNKEIDLLLRRLGRRDGEGARDAVVDEHHLDADELSSYAQNALPPAARARYTQHLAECPTCRRLATELSLALGVTTAAAPVVAVPASGGLKKFLSSLLSPMVLRYAIPALGVIVVMVVGFVVLRQREAREGMMAQVDVRATQSPNTQPEPPATPSPNARGMLGDSKEQQPASVNAAKEAEGPRETAAERPAKSDAPADKADTGSAVAAAAPAPVATPSDDSAFMPSERKVQTLPLIVPKPSITLDGETAKKEAKQEAQPITKSTEEEVAKEKAQANEAPVATRRPAGRIAADRVQQSRSRPEENTAAPAAGSGERAATRRRDDDAKDEAETRSVAGRKFRKERGIWTDTAYDSPTRTVQMTRGSEQFRALVADEPAIGKIAEQLDGEFIVVWKGRAYRIR